MTLFSHSDIDGFREAVQLLAGSAVHVIRQLAAQALVAVVPRDDVMRCVASMLDSLPEDRAHCFSFNLLHGVLLQIEALLNAYVSSVLYKTLTYHACVDEKLNCMYMCIVHSKVRVPRTEHITARN